MHDVGLRESQKNAASGMILVQEKKRKEIGNIKFKKQQIGNFF